MLEYFVQKETVRSSDAQNFELIKNNSVYRRNCVESWKSDDRPDMIGEEDRPGA
jgi:hypothetical protein